MNASAMFTRRLASRPVASALRTRVRGDHGEPQKVYTGAEATIRKVLPKDEHWVLAIIGGTFLAVYGITKACGGKKKEEA